MSTKPTKTSSGGMREAKQRLAQAEKYLQIAKAETGKDTASLQVAATNASKDFELLIGKKDEAN